MVKRNIGDFHQIHAGRSAVLLCTGASASLYRAQEENLIVCGVNSAAFMGHRLDYLFIQDHGHANNPNSYVNRTTEYDACRPTIAKFYGVTMSSVLNGAG